MNGFLNLNKQSGITSHDAVNLVRKIFVTKKVGHAGTLDPAAFGVLPIAIGRATKFIEYISDCDKSYRAEILFGMATDSGDLEGKIIARENFSMPTINELQDVAKNFVGEIEQTPPKFSAIKIKGRKAYDLARKNLNFDMPRRRVKIFRLEIVSLTEDTMTIEVDCGKGTYIRSLAVEFGKQFNIPATLKKLLRTRVGDFKLEDSLTIDQLSVEKILPIENCLQHLPVFELPRHRISAFLNGLPTNVNAPNQKILRIIAEGKFIGVGRIENGELRSSKKMYS